MAAAAAAAGNAPAAPKYWLLSYQYVPDILEKRGPYREQHLAGAKSHLDAGRLVAAGAVGDPVEGATFFFKNISKVCACVCICVRACASHEHAWVAQQVARQGAAAASGCGIVLLHTRQPNPDATPPANYTYLLPTTTGGD